MIAQAVTGVADSKAGKFLLIGAGVLAFVGVFLIGRRILQAFDVIETKEEKEVARGTSKIELKKYSSPSYWKSLSDSKQKSLIAKDKELNSIAVGIDKANNTWFGTQEDEEAMIGEIKRISSLGELSYVAMKYQQNTKSDIWSDVKRALDKDADINQVIRHIESLK